MIPKTQGTFGPSTRIVILMVKSCGNSFCISDLHSDSRSNSCIQQYFVCILKGKSLNLELSQPLIPSTIDRPKPKSAQSSTA